jgi:CheY-like chemotaxis protein
MLALVVDDDEAIVNLLRDVLQAHGIDVISASNGRDALERLKLVRVDIILSDIYMPTMDGLKLHAAVREHADYAKLPFLFISGYDDKYTAGAVRDPRLEGFWKKGHSVEELLQWVEYLATPLEKRSRARPDGVMIPPFVEGTSDPAPDQPRKGKPPA